MQHDGATFSRNEAMPFSPIPASFSRIPPPPITSNDTQTQVCSVCSRPRSRQYHSMYSTQSEKTARQTSVCRRCRVQDITPNEARNIPDSKILTAHPTKTERTKVQKRDQCKHQLSAAKRPTKGDAEISEDARSLTPSSVAAEEIVRGIKVVRIPENRRKKVSRTRASRDPLSSFHRYSDSSADELSDRHRVAKLRPRTQSRGRTIARQVQSPRRSQNERLDLEDSTMYKGVIEDANLARKAADEARRGIRTSRQLSSDMQAFAERRAASARRDTVSPDIPECRYSYIVRLEQTKPIRMLIKDAEISSGTIGA